MIVNALLYPFKGSGWIMMVLGAVLAVLLNIASFAPILGCAVSFYSAGYFTAFYFEIITSTVNGEANCPDWPNVTNVWDDLLHPLLHLFGAILVSFLPLLICLYTLDKTSEHFHAALWGAAGFGCLYFPMAILGIVQFGNLCGTLPHLVLPALWRCLPGYLLAVVTLILVLILSAVVQELAEKVAFLRWLLTSAVSLYFLMVQARFIGLLYVKNEARIGWF
jgi:hypothetical protein